MEATGDDPARMAFGQVKILVLALLPFWVSRWHLLRGQAGRRVLGDRRSVLLYVPVILLGIVIIALLMHFGGRLLSPFVANAGLLMAIGFAFFLATMALEIYLSVWKVGAALGNSRLTIPASFRLMHGNFWWSLGFFLAMFLPLMVVHYLLAVLPLGRPDISGRSSPSIRSSSAISGWCSPPPRS